MSHPSWVRGLKLDLAYRSGEIKESHPSWVRGLKLVWYDGEKFKMSVAPFMGAWIET